MANLQFITILKHQLSISMIFGMMMLTPIKSIGNSKTPLINDNLQPSGASLTIQETHKQLSFSLRGGTNNDTVKKSPEMDSHYPGGKAAWNLFFKRKFVYPDEAVKNGINRVVSVRFIVSKEGSIKKAKMINGIDRTYDKAVLTVVNMMPDWTPFLGRKWGQ